MKSLELNDIELASLIDALLCQQGEIGLTSSATGLLNRFSDELRERGYSWESNYRGLVLHAVLDQQTTKS